MLGIRENYPSTDIQRQHFAFKTSVEELKRAADWLRKKGIQPENFFWRESRGVVCVFIYACRVYLFQRSRRTFLGIISNVTTSTATSIRDC